MTTGSQGARRWKLKNGRRVPADPRIRRIVEMLVQFPDRPYREIAKEFSLSVVRIWQIRKFAGLPARREKLNA